MNLLKIKCEAVTKMAKKNFDMSTLEDTTTSVPVIKKTTQEDREKKRERQIKIAGEDLIDSIATFSNLPPATTLKGAEGEIKALVAFTQVAIYETGKRILHVRDHKLWEQGNYAGFKEWAENSGTGLSSRMAYNYATVVETFGDRLKEREDLEISKLIETARIAQKHPDHIDQIFEASQTSTIKEIRALAKDFSPKKLEEHFKRDSKVNLKNIPKEEISEAEKTMFKLKVAFEKALRFNKGNKNLKQSYKLIFGDN